MKVNQCLPTDEIFTHVDDRDGTVRHFNASAMQRNVPDLMRSGRIRLITAALDPEYIRFVIERRGVEPWKLARMKEPYLSQPILGAEMDNGSVLTVDGHHRLVCLYRAKKESYQLFIFPMEEWKEYLITDFPTEAYITDSVRQSIV